MQLRNKAAYHAYKSWCKMRERCRDKNHMHYSRYGGKGIKICKRWDDFYIFLADMGERPQGTSLDRKNSAKGYCPSNCRWATANQQMQNRARFQGWSSKYKGVQKWKRKNGFAWGSTIQVNGKAKFLGVTKTAKEAAKNYDKAALLHFGEHAKINFKRRKP